MKITGQFKNINNTLYTLEIIDTSSSSSDKTFDDYDILFSGESPIVIEDQNSDLFEQNIYQTMEVNLVTKEIHQDLFFGKQPHSVQVKLYEGDGMEKNIFDGYLTPQSYNQNYVSVYEEVTLNCVDNIGVLQNIYPSNIEGWEWGYTTLYDFLYDYCGLTNIIWNDTLLTIDSSGNKSVVDKVQFNTTIWKSDDEDDQTSLFDILESVLKYFNLHIRTIVIDNNIYYELFDWSDKKSINSTKIKTITKDDYMDSNTNITIGECYNKFVVNGKKADVDITSSNPLESDDMISDYSSNDLYCTYCKSWDTYDGWKQQWTQGYRDANQKDKYTYYNYFVRLLTYDNDNENGQTWTFNNNYDSSKKQWENLLELWTPWTCYPLQWGKMDMYDSEVTSPSMENYIVIGVNGFTSRNVLEYYYNDSGTKTLFDTFPSQNSNTFPTSKPIMEYNNSNSINYYSSTGMNYFLISGKIRLQPTLFKSGQDECDSGYQTAKYGINHTTFKHLFYKDYRNYVGYNSKYITLNNDDVYVMANQTQYSGSNNISAKQSFRFYNPTTSNQYNTIWVDKWKNEPMYPPVEDDQGRDFTTPSEFKCVSTDGSDQWESIPLFNCEMRVGNYYLCEDVTVSSSGDVSVGSGKLSWLLDDTSEYELSGDVYKPYITTENGIKYYCEWVQDGTAYTTQEDIDDFNDKQDLTLGNQTLSGDGKLLVPNSGQETVPMTIKKTPLIFTIGINPDVDDYILGQEHSIENTVKWEYNLEDSGLAIPINQRLVGDMSFKIVSINDISFDENWKTSSSFWNHSHWKSTTRSVMKYTQYITLKDFEIKVVNSSDNNILDDQDIKYQIVSDESYTNKKEEDFDLITSLTTSEAAKLQTTTDPILNNPLDLNNGQIYTYYKGVSDEDGNPISGKCEEWYIDEYYDEYRNPKVEVETTLKDYDEVNDVLIQFSDNYKVTNKTFIPYKRTRDIGMGTITINSRQV